MKGFFNKIKTKFQHLNHLHIEKEIVNKDYRVKQIFLLKDGRFFALFFEFVMIPFLLLLVQYALHLKLLVLDVDQRVSIIYILQ